MNTMTLEGYHAKIENMPELDSFRGEIVGLNGGADFYGRNPKELRAEFRKSLHVFGFAAVAVSLTRGIQI